MARLLRRRPLPHLKALAPKLQHILTQLDEAPHGVTILPGRPGPPARLAFLALLDPLRPLLTLNLSFNHLDALKRCVK